MKIQEIVTAINGQVITKIFDQDININYGVACDLLSNVMANAKSECAFITILSNMNILAVASLLEMGCVVISSGVKVQDNVIEKANEEGICVITSNLTTFEICGILYNKGLGK